MTSSFVATTIDTSEKLNRLRASLRSMGRVLIAYSGGVDSAFLLRVARSEIGERAVPFIGLSPSLMPEEHDAALELAQQMGIEVRVVETHEMDDPNYASNPTNRCYFCKSHLFDTLGQIARDEGFDTVCDGTNLDDMTEWRPGAQAGGERGIRSPLREADLNKAEIRHLSRELGLPTWDKPAMPCLSSRIPYGTPVTPKALQMIGRAEAFLREGGLREVRVRHHEENGRFSARLEAAPDEMPALFERRDAINERLRELGYSSILLDLEGYKRGKMNDALGLKPTSQPITLHLR